ncbi:MAG: hypothetical protein P9M03_09290, partial [Candidatus Theseobacter exili]|nr:hypothetical protein [Candidatus Theseobacter exili]
AIFEPENTKKPDLEISGSTQYVGVAPYGIKYFSELFTRRQLFALNTLCDLVKNVKQQVISDGEKIMMEDDGIPLDKGGDKLTAYSDAIMIYCSLVISKLSDSLNTLCPWEPVAECSRQLFNRQAISMAWEFAEGNVIGHSSGSFLANLKVLTRSFTSFPKSTPIPSGIAINCDAVTQKISQNKVISTDPPYYDNVPYADLSDFFYVWLRLCLKEVIPSLFLTIGTPKIEELVAFSYRHKDKSEASRFFMEGMTKAMSSISRLGHPSFPLTIYYAFKQSVTDEGNTISEGWEVFLEAVIRAGFSITGTWPIRTELNAALKTKLNTLASSIVLVCNKKDRNEGVTSRIKFRRELKDEMPLALENMIGGGGGISPIAPVDLAQAAIGPGMALFSKYKAVLEANGTPMSIHNALILINKTIDEYFTEAEGEMDPDTRFCIDWFQQYGFKEGLFGEADVLARAKGTSVDGMQEAGVLSAKGGKVCLYKISEYPDNWNPQADKRTSVWEGCHHMCKALEISETKAGELLAKMPEKIETIRQLAYRLYTLCERKGWLENAVLYNGLITCWHSILEESHKVGHYRKQKMLFDM